MIPLFKVGMSGQAPIEASRVLLSGFIGQGPVVDEFEQDIDELLGSGHREAVLVNSCTSAIQMVLTYLGVRSGDEVVTTPLTCVATNSPIVALGAKPVWADVDPETGLIDPVSVARKISNRTKAIIAVDWTGRPADYKKLQMLGLPVIQDAAHSLRRRVGDQSGDYTCYSFGPIKHLTAGDGGAVICPEGAAANLRLLRWYGLDRTSVKDFRCQQDIAYPGQKWHMNDVNAAIGRANLTEAVAHEKYHRNTARILHQELFSAIMNGRGSKLLKLPRWSEDSSYWVFPLLVSQGRESFQRYLADRGIMSSQVHARNDKHSGYFFGSFTEHYDPSDLPGVNWFDEHQINVPCGWWMTMDDIGHVIETILSWRP